MKSIAMLKQEKLKVSDKVTFGIGDVGANFCWTFIASFLTIYLTDTVGISVGIIGTIVLLAQLFDGLTDLFMGSIIDNTNSKMGKARPWIFWTAPILGLLIFALFNVPSVLNGTGRIVYVSIVYILVSAVFYTANNVAYSSLTSFMTTDPKERVSLGSFRFIFAVFAVLFINSFTIVFVEKFGDGQTGWTRVALLYGILCAIPLMITGFFVKEKNVAKKTKTSSVSFKEAFGALLKNKYFLLMFALYLLMYMRMTSGAVGVYYVTYILNNPNYLGLLSLAQMGPSLIGLIFVATIVGRLSIKKSIIGGLTFSIVGYLIMAISSENVVGLMIGLVITSIGGAPLTAGASALVADMGDYTYWESGIPVQGAAFSTTSAGMKIGQGIASALVGWLLAIGNYVPNATQQLDSAIFSMKALYIYFPLICTLLIIFLMCFMNIEIDMPQIREDVSVGKVRKNRIN